jgi:TonB family protein
MFMAMQRVFQFRRDVAAIVAVLLFSAPVHAQAHSDFLASLIDQKMLLLHVGDQEKVKIKKQDLPKLTGACDKAVQLKQAEWKKGKARLWFENVGLPFVAAGVHLSNGLQRPRCPMDYGHVELEITGFHQDDDPKAVEAAVREILLTPEEYMAAHGISFDLPPGTDDEAVVRCVSPVIPVRALLTVDPEFSEQARKAKFQGTVVIGLVVGTDGRVHKPHITRRLGMGLDEQALYVLPMWRFQPGTQAGKPVACETNVEVSFNLY